MSDMTSNSQGRWLQQTCTLFIQSGVQLLAEFTRQAAAWANSSLIRTNFSQPNPSVSQHPEQAGNSRGEREREVAACIIYVLFPVLVLYESGRPVGAVIAVLRPPGVKQIYNLQVRV